MDLARLYLTKNPYPRSFCPSSKRSERANQTTQAAPCTSRESARTPHGPAVYPALSPDISGQGRSPSHHAGPSQPRRRCSLSSTTKPAPRPLTCGCSTGPRTSRQRAAPPRPEPSTRRRRHSTQPHRAPELPRAPKAQGKAPRQEGSKTASRAPHRKMKQPAFADKCDAHHAGLRTAGGAAVRRVFGLEFAQVHQSSGQRTNRSRLLERERRGPR